MTPRTSSTPQNDPSNRQSHERIGASPPERAESRREHLPAAQFESFISTEWSPGNLKAYQTITEAIHRDATEDHRQLRSLLRFLKRESGCRYPIRSGASEDAHRCQKCDGCRVQKCLTAIECIRNDYRHLRNHLDNIVDWDYLQVKWNYTEHVCKNES